MRTNNIYDAIRKVDTDKYTHTVIYNGFKFAIAPCYDRYMKDLKYHATMSFTPGWPHTNHIYADTADRLVAKIIDRVLEAKKTFTEGGGFHE